MDNIRATVYGISPRSVGCYAQVLNGHKVHGRLVNKRSTLRPGLLGLLPSLTPAELLETSMVHSVAGLIAKGALTRARPFRAPHHSASMAALTGGGLKVKPGEVSLAHNGVLFLDELPEFTGIM